MRYNLLFVLFLFSVSLYAQYSSPESVVLDNGTRRYFVSNTSSQKIVQRAPNGTVTDFVGPIGSSIHGVTIYNGRVYVCNGTRVRGYNINTAVEEFNVLVSGSSFLNDLAVDTTNGMIYVSDFTARRIYKVNSANSDYWIYVANTTSQPNGVYVDKPRNRLLICCWGGSAPVRSVNFADSSITTLITTPYSNCDGISLDRNDNVYISTWGIQSVVRYDINFVSSPVVVASGLSNPADIHVSRITDTLAIPNAGNSTVSFVLLSIPAGVQKIGNEIPSSFSLSQNYPNPFNPVTSFKFQVASSSSVKILVFDVLGREVATLVNEQLNAGTYEVDFDGTNSPSGVYYYQLTVGDFMETKRMVLIK